jgi:hypothetical protein
MGQCCERGEDGARCPGRVSERVAASHTSGCQVMCDAHWLAYHGKALGVPAESLGVEAMLPLAQQYQAIVWGDGALGYGEDHGDDVRKDAADWLPDVALEKLKLAAHLAARMGGED